MSDVSGFDVDSHLEKQKRELSCNLRFQLHVSILCVRAGGRPTPGYPYVCVSCFGVRVLSSKGKHKI